MFLSGVPSAPGARPTGGGPSASTWRGVGISVGGWVQGADLRSAVSFQVVPRSHGPLQVSWLCWMAFFGGVLGAGWVVDFGEFGRTGLGSLMGWGLGAFEVSLR